MFGPRTALRGARRCGRAVQHGFPADGDRPVERAPVQRFRQIVGDPECHRVGLGTAQLRQGHDGLIDLCKLIVGFLRPMIVADDGLRPEHRHDVQKMELEIARDRARREAHADHLIGQNGFLIVLARFDVLGECLRITPQSGDLFRIMFLHLGCGPERVCTRRGRLELRRVVVAHRLVRVERFGAEFAKRYHAARREICRLLHVCGTTLPYQPE